MKSEIVLALMVAPVLFAAAAATYAEFKVRRRRGRKPFEWMWRFAFFYAAPALALSFFSAYCFSTFVLIPFFPGSTTLCGIHDPECLTRVDPSRNFLVSVVGLSAAELLGLIYVVVTAWRRVSSRRVTVYR